MAPSVTTTTRKTSKSPAKLPKIQHNSSSLSSPTPTLKTSKSMCVLIKKNALPLRLWLSNSSLQQPLILLLSITILAICPSIIFLLLCTTLIRQLAASAAKHIRPDLASIIPARSVGFGSDLIYNRATPKCSLLISMHLAGHVELTELRVKLSRILDRKSIINDDHGADKESLSLSELCYPELKQTVASWFGILFWKWDANFKIENHVNLYPQNGADKSILSDEEMVAIGNELLLKPFAKGQSPWEFLVLYNCRRASEGSAPERTSVIFRVHHVIGDGVSLMKFCMDELTKDVAGKLSQPVVAVERVKVQKSRERESCCSISRKFLFPLFAAHDLAKLMVKSWDFNQWRIPELQRARQVNAGVTESLPLDYIKKIKNNLNVTTTGSLLAVFAGGLRNFMISEPGSGKKIPDRVHCMTMLPFPGRSDKLVNNMTAAIVELPLNDPCPRSRLLAIEKNLQDMKKCTIPTSIHYLMGLAGLWMAPIAHFFFRNCLHTCLMSNFQGPSQAVKFLGYEVLDGGFGAGFGPGSQTIGITALSYNGKIRLTAGFDQAILPMNVPCQGFIDKIVEELAILDAVSTCQIPANRPVASSSNPAASTRSQDFVGQLENHFADVRAQDHEPNADPIIFEEPWKLSTTD